MRADGAILHPIRHREKLPVAHHMREFRARMYYYELDPMWRGAIAVPANDGWRGLTVWDVSLLPHPLSLALRSGGSCSRAVAAGASKSSLATGWDPSRRRVAAAASPANRMPLAGSTCSVITG